MHQRHCVRYRERLDFRTGSDNFKTGKRETPADKTGKAEEKDLIRIQQQDQEE